MQNITIKLYIFFLTFFINMPLFASTLDEVKERGYLNCGVAEYFVGFATPNDSGEWIGFDVDLCRSISIAIFNDKNKVKFIPTTSRSRFPSLALGEIDVLIRNTTWSYSRDVNLEFEFAGINFYDGQSFLVPKNLDIKNISDLDSSKICVLSGTSNQLNIKNYFNKNSLDYDLLVSETNEESLNNYINGNCDVYTSDLSVLAESRTKIPDSYNHVILNNIISKEPLGPVVRKGDDHWEDLIRWTLYVLIIAEEKNITSDNVDENLNSNDSEVLRLLGEVGNYGEMLELDNKWAYNIIKKIGNYSTIYEKNIGEKTLLGLDRGLNNLWTNGGMLYAPPYR